MLRSPAGLSGLWPAVQLLGRYLGARGIWPLASCLLDGSTGGQDLEPCHLSVCSTHTPHCPPRPQACSEAESEESRRPLPTVHSGVWRPKGLVLMVVMEQLFFAEKCLLVI